jgi:hypothetical protein
VIVQTITANNEQTSSKRNADTANDFSQIPIGSECIEGWGEQGKMNNGRL